jgi:voltage-gated potassium channel
MDRAHLYRLLQPRPSEVAGRVCSGVHHAMVAAGIAVMLAMTVPELRGGYGGAMAAAFYAIAGFFVAEFVLRFYLAPQAPGGEQRGPFGSRLAWVFSFSGLIDLLGVVPAAVALAGRHEASIFGFVWVFKLIRYAPGLTILERVILHARHALLSVLLGVFIVLLAAGSLAYLLERDAQPEAFGSIPAALWWAIVTLTTTGYGDAVPQTVAGRMLAGVVMVSGILVFALWAGILATGYADEMRRREFLRTWDLVARVPFFHNLGATLIAEVARLLRVREYPAKAVVMRRGEPGDCMFFVVEGEVEVQLEPQSLRFGADYFFGELALLTGAPRNATIVTTRSCTMLTLDIVDFFELLSRQPELARVIHDEASRRLAPGTPVHAALRAMMTRDTETAS